MAARRKPSNANDHLNRDGYIFLSILSSQFSADIEKLCAKYDLTEGHYRVLWVLCLSDTSEPLAMGDIVDGVINKASDVTRLVDKLEKLKYVSRSTSPEDKRRVLVKATAQGKRAFESLTKLIKEVHYDQWSGLTSDELEQLVMLMKKANSGTNSQ